MIQTAIRNAKMGRRTRRRRGSTLLEFVLGGTFLLLPLIIGAGTVGMSLLENIQVVQLNRDAGNLFARGTDFSKAANRTLLLQLANGLDISDAGGSGVIILSAIERDAGGQVVCTRQIVIGNGGLPAAKASRFVNPTKFLDSAGHVDTADPSANADAFLATFNMAPGETVYVAETYFQTSSYDWPGLLSGTGIYTKSFF